MKNNVNTLLLTGLLIVAAGCNDDEFLTDTGFQSNVINQIQSTQDLELLVTGGYFAMSEGGVHGNQAIHEAYVSDLAQLKTNLSTVSRQDSRRFYSRDFSNRNEERINQLWSGGYRVIRHANKVITRVEKNGPFADEKSSWTNRILGEAYWLRAWANFMLVRVFGPAYGANNNAPAIILLPEEQKDGFDNKGLSSVEETYALIVSDVEKAIELLPEQYVAGRDPVGYQDRANKMAARFLAVRVHMQMRNWQKAEEYADAILNANRYPLNQDPIQAWNKDRPGNVKGSEVVFQFINEGNNTGFRPPIIPLYLGFPSSEGEQSKPNVQQDVSLSKSMKTRTGWDNHAEASKDKRYAQLFVSFGPGEDPRAAYQIFTEREVWANKWYRAATTPTASNKIASYPLMRSAEIHLSRAYLRWRKGDQEGARNDLNAVRQRAGIGDYPGPVTSEAIEIERMKELVFEDDRLYYLQILQKDIPPGDRSSPVSFPWGQVTFPVPQSEADLNAAVE
ncbi:MAG: RagB/SusD family nutrient uptake outer membrane protein [Ferruginibacter sp.]|nr:RagB/SusD family nutrient uptake outer membrane protein [Cytophagales bacterium]